MGKVAPAREQGNRQAAGHGCHAPRQGVSLIPHLQQRQTSHHQTQPQPRGGDGEFFGRHIGAAQSFGVQSQTFQIIVLHLPIPRQHPIGSSAFRCGQWSAVLHHVGRCRHRQRLRRGEEGRLKPWPIAIAIADRQIDPFGAQVDQTGIGVQRDANIGKAVLKVAQAWHQPLRGKACGQGYPHRTVSLICAQDRPRRWRWL